MLLRRLATLAAVSGKVLARSRYASGKYYGNNNNHARKAQNKQQPAAAAANVVQLKDTSAKPQVVTSSSSIVTNQQFSLFEDEIAFRRDQAARTVLVKFPPDSIVQDLIKNLVATCHNANHRIRNVFTFGADDKSALVEFELIESVSFVMNKAAHFRSPQRVPSTTRCLFYDHRAGSSNSSNSNNRNSEIGKGQKSDPLASLEKTVSSIKGCNEQIYQFYQHGRVDELSYRVRFFVASLIEDAMRVISRNCFCTPFGSSLNLTGSKSSDLDLSLYLDEAPWAQAQAQAQAQVEPSKNSPDEGVFRFLTKLSKTALKDSGKALLYFDLLKFLIQQVLPGFELNSIIKFARVPIIKFSFMPVKLDCDLSMSSLSSAYNTTKLLWLFNRFDDRVGPLIFLIKYWATLTGIHQPMPGVFITNYQLTSLVLFYLQKTTQPVLIDVDSLIEKTPDLPAAASQHPQIVKIKENLSVNELRFKFRARNTMHLGELFAGFCEFYSTFDFEKQTIYLTSTSRRGNVKKSYLHIESFLDPDTCASKNVTRKEIDYFKRTCQTSLATIKKINANQKRSSKNAADAAAAAASAYEFNLVTFFEMMRLGSRASNQLDHGDNLIDEFNQ